MSAIKRNISSRQVRMTTRTSALNSSVTLYELERSSSSRPTKRVKLEDKICENSTEPIPDETSEKETTTKKSKKTTSGSKSPRKTKSILQTLETPHPTPEGWREVYDKIKEMRSKTTAPVDTMGCDQAHLKESDPKNGRFSTLVSLMLSSQTKDEVTDAAVKQLRAALGGTLSVAGVIDADESTISNAIGKVGFWRRKTGYIRETAIRLRDEFDSDVPKTVDELCSLPGVGPKMAFLTLQSAWNLNAGIGVDVHVHRITNRLGWHKPPTKTPEETRLNLQSWLPLDLHKEINHLLVGFGQTICLPTAPRCEQCTLSNEGLCPSAQKPKIGKAKSRSKSKSKTIEVVVDTKVDEAERELSASPAGPKIEIALEETRIVSIKEE